MTQRWQFSEQKAPFDSLILRWNPNGMTEPYLQQITTTSAISPIDGLVRATRSLARPREWAFTGFLRTEDQQQDMRDWADKTNLVAVTDHINRTFLVRFVRCEVVDKKPTKTNPWRGTYTMHCLSYGRTS